MTYNIWIIRRDNPTITKYCSTVVCDTMEEAVAKTIIGCKLIKGELLNWRFVRNNPKYNWEEQERLEAFVRPQLG